MILEVGKAGKARFIWGVKKTNIFECGTNGIVMERENKKITLYVTNNRCSEIYCVVPLGGNEILKKNKFICAVYSENIMLVDGTDIMVVVDFEKKKVAVNKPHIKVTGKKDWAEAPQMDWKPGFNAMFGVSSASNAEMDREAAAEFWSWFVLNEGEIEAKSAAGGEEAKKLNASVAARLGLVFPYEKPKHIEVQIRCNEEANEFYFYHFNKEQLAQDAMELGEMMPQVLQQTWDFMVEA